MRPTRRDAALAWLQWAAREGVQVIPCRDDWSVSVHGRAGQPEPVAFLNRGRELKADILAVLTGTKYE